MEERNRVILEAVEEMLARGDLERAARTVADLHSADGAEVLPPLPDEDEVEILTALEPAAAAHILLEMEEPHQVELAARMRPRELFEILSLMPIDEAVDLLGDIPDARSADILRLFGREEAFELRELLAYPDRTAGGLMTTDYISVSPDETVSETIERLRRVSPDVETIYYVYVVSEDGILDGVLSLRELIVSAPDRRVGDMVSDDVITVPLDEDQEQVAEVISKYDLLAVPVVDRSRKMLGIVTVDDVMEVLSDEAEEDIVRFAGGTGFEEDSRPGGLMANFGRRLPWFVVAVVVEMLVVGGILKLYSPMFTDYVVLILFIPLLVTMGGNIAVQSSTLVEHRLSGGKPLKRRALKAVAAEVAWGVTVGLAAGGITGLLAWGFNQPRTIGLAVGVSLALTIVAAAFIGCALPVAMKAARKDPGAVSGPLLGTTMDVISLAIYLGIATLLI